MPVNDYSGLPADSVPHEGLVNKWPFDSEKKTYPYWESTLGEQVDAVYDRTADVKGMETYVYKVTVSDAKTDVIEGVPGIYDTVKEIYVDPRTGGIVNQTEDQQRYLKDGQKILDLQLAFTDEEQQAKVDEVNDKYKLIDLALNIVPVVGYAVGIPVFLIGLALLFLSRRGRGTGAVPVDGDRAAGDARGHRLPASAGRPRRSRCPGCTCPGCPTSRPTPGRGPRATRARAAG